MAIPELINNAVLEDIHSTQVVSFATLSLAQKISWTYFHPDIPAKATECKMCFCFGKDLKSVNPHSKWSRLNKFEDPKEKKQTDFVAQF